MRNRFWALRHGLSLANEAGLIVSLPANGLLPQFGLSPTGIEQARRAGRQVVESCSKEAVIFASDFSRAHQAGFTCRVGSDKIPPCRQRSK